MPRKLSFAVGCLLLISALVGAPVARAQSVQFDLPPQPLADSLRAVASATHTNVLFDADVVAGSQAPALKGTLNVEQAIASLLAKTGLHYRRVDEHTITILRGTEEAAPAGATSPLELNEVVVTGTRIAGTISVSPLTTIDRTAIDTSGYASIGQLLLAMPQNFSGGQNPGVVGVQGNNFSVSGAYTANIHGLGSDSTLTLVDGHRFAYDGTTSVVDLSIIPLAAIDRVEMLTDGASAIYGSDAVAGVVNVILRQDYEGVTADARYGDVTTGHTPLSQYSALGGHDWKSGNAMVAYEYSHSDQLYASDRPFSTGAAQPISLLPSLNRNSLLADLRQELWDGIAASVEALYTSRSSAQVYTTPSTTIYDKVSVTQYGISPSLQFALPADWSMTLTGTISHDGDSAALNGMNLATNRPTGSSTVADVNDLRVGEIQATGTVLELPSGPVKLAMGGGYRAERYKDLQPPTETQLRSTVADREVEYGYGELRLPIVEPSDTRLLLHRLDLSGAFRYERYSDFGGQSTPKVGLIYVPASYLRLRATWSKSFRAPELLDVAGTRQVYLIPANFYGGPRGTTTLLEYGSNPLLGPERARSVTVGADILWPARPSFVITPTYFHIDYDNRIVTPIDNLLHALSNPGYAPFVTASPSAAEQQALIAQADTFSNYTSGQYEPANVSSIIHDNYQNATAQKIHGVDLTARDAWPLPVGRIEATAGATWLTILQRTISTAPETELTGTLFNPPKLKARASVTWRWGGLGFTGILNYVDGEMDNTGSTTYPVASWSTVDAQLSYAFDPSVRGVFHSVKASLSVQNLLDRYPPHIAAASTEYPALSYDFTNTSPLGRFVSAYIAKSW